MGGKSSSSSKSEQTTIQTDKRVAATDNAMVYQIEGNNSTLTDYGAIDKAGQITLEALDAQTQIALLALGQSNRAIETIGNGADKVLEFVDTQRQDEENRTLEKMLPYLLGTVSILALTGTLKLR